MVSSNNWEKISIETKKAQEPVNVPLWVYAVTIVVVSYIVW